MSERHHEALIKVKKEQEEKFLPYKKTNVNLFDELIHSSKRFGAEKEIVEDINGTITYKNLLLNSYVLSETLSKQVTGDKPIGLLLPNSIGKVVALYSLFRLQKTPALLNFSMGEKSILECCETAGVEIVLTSRQFIEKGNLSGVIELLSRNVTILYLEDVKESIEKTDKLRGLFLFKTKKKVHKEGEIILFTSGSESKPKGVVLSHTAFFTNVFQALSTLDLQPDKDKLLNSLPMFHSFGLTAGTFLPILAGVPVYLYPSPLAYKEIPALFFDKKATVIFGTSTFFDLYGKHANEMDFSSCRYAVAGAEKLKDDVKTTWLEKFGVRIIEGYGVTETAPVISINVPSAYKKNSVGRILPGMTYKLEAVEGIAQGGKLLVKGPNVMKGYLIHEKGFIPQEDWYDTGDVVDVDENGFITILSRLKRFAKIGGEMVSLNLIEQQALDTYSHGGFFAVSVPDDRKGERVILFTTDEDISDGLLKKHIKGQKLSSLLIPYKIVHIQEVPMLGAGKTDYVTLTEMAKDVKKGWFK